MDALMGLALFGAGMTAGGGLIVSYYKSLKGVQDSERKIAARNMDEARRYNEAMRLELDNKTDCLNRLELKRQLEASWCDGYEAGMREGMRGVTVGDVVTFTRLRRARDNRAANDEGGSTDGSERDSGAARAVVGRTHQRPAG